MRRSLQPQRLNHFCQSPRRQYKSMRLSGGLCLSQHPVAPAEPQQLSPLTGLRTHFIHIHTDLRVYFRPSRCTDIWEIVGATATKKEKSCMIPPRVTFRQSVLNHTLLYLWVNLHNIGPAYEDSGLIHTTFQCLKYNIKQRTPKWWFA